MSISSELTKYMQPPISKTKRSGGPSSDKGKATCALNGGGRGARSIIDTIPSQYLVDSIEMRALLLGIYSPRDFRDDLRIADLARQWAQRKMLTDYRDAILNGQAGEPIALEALEAVLEPSMDAMQLALLRRYADLIPLMDTWTESQLTWAGQMADECRNFRLAMDWWFDCQEETIAEGRFPGICGWLYELMAQQLKPSLRHYGLGQADSAIFRGYLGDAIARASHQAEGILHLWPHRSLILNALQAIRAQRFVDDYRLPMLEEAKLRCDRAIKRLERALLPLRIDSATCLAPK